MPQSLFSRHRRLQTVDEPHNNTDKTERKKSNKVFKAIESTLECSTSYWNYIDEMYSDIRQGEHETIYQLDQHIKQLVEKCQIRTKMQRKYIRQNYCHVRLHPLTIKETETLTSNGFVHINRIYTFNNHVPILLIIYISHKSHTISSQ